MPYLNIQEKLVVVAFIIGRSTLKNGTNSQPLLWHLTNHPRAAKAPRLHPQTGAHDRAPSASEEYRLRPTHLLAEQQGETAPHGAVGWAWCPSPDEPAARSILSTGEAVGVNQ